MSQAPLQRGLVISPGLQDLSASIPRGGEAAEMWLRRGQKDQIWIFHPFAEPLAAPGAFLVTHSVVME